MPNLSLKTLSSFHDAESYQAAWNEFVLRAGADVYQTFEWCSTWWKYYGTKRQLHLILAFVGEDLVGIVPAFTETLWLGPLRVRAAKLVGSDFSLSLCNLAVLPNALEEVTTHCLRYFLGNQRCDVLLFGPLSGEGAKIDALIAAAQQEPTLVGETKALGNSCNTYFALPANFADYIKALDKKQRSNFKRRNEQSAKSHTITSDIISSTDQVIPEFENFCREHELQWRPDRRMGHFGDWPHSIAFNRDLIASLSKGGAVRFYRILSDGKVVSSQYGFVFGQTLYWRLPARVRNEEWDRWSLGTMGLTKMIETSITEGIHSIEGGRGHYDYKIHHGAHESPLRTVQFTRRGFGVSFRVRLFRFFATVFLEKGYYELLFYRIGPHFRFLQRPLWSFWIRTTW